MDAPRTARAMWKLFEPLHAVTYFADECIAQYGEAGLKGFWMGYFAGRAAPMGPVGPAVVDATFFSFNPDRVARALPDAWSLAAPDRVLEARLVGVDKALGRILGPDGVGADIGAMASDLARAAELARAALEGLTVDGRPLAAANLALGLARRAPPGAVARRHGAARAPRRRPRRGPGGGGSRRSPGARHHGRHGGGAESDAASGARAGTTTPGTRRPT